MTDAFSKRMDIVAKRVTTNADKLIRKLAIDVETYVVTATPVDTGRARSNWLAEIDRPSAETVEARSAEETISAAKATINKYNGDRNEAVFITNNLPYIKRLNEGHSAQAPAQFVESAALAAARNVGNFTLMK